MWSYGQLWSATPQLGETPDKVLWALTEPNPKNNGPQNFFMKCLVTGPNILTPLAGNLTFPSIIGLSRINESKDTVQGYSTVKKWN